VIAALAQAGWVLDNDEYIKLAENTSNFILSNLKNKNAELLHRYRDGEAAILANLNDYSFLIHGLIELYQATLDSYYLSKALELKNYLLENFWNNKSAGFFFTSKKAEKLLTREIKVYDGALPSGNSIAMGNLIKLSHITGQIELEKMAEEMSKTFSNSIKKHPSSYSQFLTALNSLFGPFNDLVLAGNKEKKDFNNLLNTLRSEYILDKVIVYRPVNIEDIKIEKMADYLKKYKNIDNKTTVYVCQNYTCKLPTTDINKMLELIKN